MMPQMMTHGMPPAMNMPHPAVAASYEKKGLNLSSLIGGPSPQTAAHSPMPASDGNTTVMLRNIPVKYNRDAVLQDMDNRGFAGLYDFLYLPIDFQTGNTVGYAFINFVDSESTARFRSNYDGLQLSPDSAKICQVGLAKAQGKAQNVEQYRNSSVMAMEDRFRPVMFENGVRVPLPPPTRMLKPVKPRAKPNS